MILFWIFIGLVLLFGLTVFFGAPYVPTRRQDVRHAFENLYPLSEKDVLLDIGSGDGVVLRVAANFGAKAIGYEINPLLVLISCWLSRKQPRVSTKLANFWQTKFPAKVTVIYIFGDSRDIKRMTKRVQTEVDRLNRPLHLISYGFKLPGKSELASTKSHHLYMFTPSHGKAVTV